MSEQTMNLKIKVWRQEGPHVKGRFETYVAENVSPDMSFLEMLDVVNTRLEQEGKEPIAFDSDCREGICGTCGAVVNGRAHGPLRATTLCQVHMRHFNDGDTIVIEPFRAEAFPIVKDLVVGRSALDRIIRVGGYISVRTGEAPEAHAVAVSKRAAEEAMDAAACIGCGACVAACPNASASLFTAAKITQLAKLPQGNIERRRRAVSMIQQMDKEGFGSCPKHYQCEVACPKGIKVSYITAMKSEYLKALVSKD